MHTVLPYGLSVNSWIQSLLWVSGILVSCGKADCRPVEHTCCPTTLDSKPFLLTSGAALTFCEAHVMYCWMARVWCFILTPFKASWLLLSLAHWGAEWEDVSGGTAPLISCSCQWQWIRDWVTVDMQHPLTFFYPLPLFFVVVAHLLAKPTSLADFHPFIHPVLLQCHHPDLCGIHCCQGGLAWGKE